MSVNEAAAEPDTIGHHFYLIDAHAESALFVVARFHRHDVAGLEGVEVRLIGRSGEVLQWC